MSSLIGAAWGAVRSAGITRTGRTRTRRCGSMSRAHRVRPAGTATSGGAAAISLISCACGMALPLANCGGASWWGNSCKEGTMRLICRKCGSAHYPLTPARYCYLCFSRFGSATQVAMLLLAYNPYLTAEDLDRCLRLENRGTAEYIWHQVRLRLDKEVKSEELLLHDRRVHTQNSVIFATVHLRQLEATVGAVKINDVMQPVYAVPRTDSREWATSEAEALSLGQQSG